MKFLKFAVVSISCIFSVQSTTIRNVYYNNLEEKRSSIFAPSWIKKDGKLGNGQSSASSIETLADILEEYSTSPEGSKKEQLKVYFSSITEYKAAELNYIYAAYVVDQIWYTIKNSYLNQGDNWSSVMSKIDMKKLAEDYKEAIGTEIKEFDMDAINSSIEDVRRYFSGCGVIDAIGKLPPPSEFKKGYKIRGVDVSSLQQVKDHDFLELENGNHKYNDDFENNDKIIERGQGEDGEEGGGHYRIPAKYTVDFLKKEFNAAIGAGNYHHIIDDYIKNYLFDPKAVDDNGDTFLHYIVRTVPKDRAADVTEVIRALLDIDGVDPIKKNKKGETPLHIALKAKVYTYVELLIEKDFTREPDSDGNTVLHLAGKNIPGFVTTIARKANELVYVKNNKGETIFDIIKDDRSNKLIKDEIQETKENFFEAIKFGDDYIINKFYTKFKNEIYEGLERPITLAISWKRYDLIDRLIKDQEVFLNSTKGGKNILQLAIDTKDVKTIGKIFSTLVFDKNDKKLTFAEVAPIKNGKMDYELVYAALRSLESDNKLFAGFVKKITESDFDGEIYEALVKSAINNNNIDALSSLVDSQRINNSYGQKTILDFAIESKNLELVKLVLKSNPDMSKASDEGLTYLHKAIVLFGQNNNNSMKDIIKVIIDKLDKNTLNILDSKNQTALHLAAQFLVDADIIKALQDKGIDCYVVDKDKKTALNIALGEYKHQSGVFNMKNRMHAFKETVLMLMRGKKGHYIVSEKLDINTIKDKELTIQLLKDDVYSDVDISHIKNEKDENGNTLLHIVVDYRKNLNRESVSVERLISEGLDCFAKNNKNETPFDIADRVEGFDKPLLLQMQMQVLKEKVKDAAKQVNVEFLNTIKYNPQYKDGEGVPLINSLFSKAKRNDLVYQILDNSDGISMDRFGNSIFHILANEIKKESNIQDKFLSFGAKYKESIEGDANSNKETALQIFARNTKLDISAISALDFNWLRKVEGVNALQKYAEAKNQKYEDVLFEYRVLRLSKSNDFEEALNDLEINQDYRQEDERAEYLTKILAKIEKKDLRVFLASKGADLQKAGFVGFARWGKTKEDGKHVRKVFDASMKYKYKPELINAMVDELSNYKIYDFYSYEEFKKGFNIESFIGQYYRDVLNSGNETSKRFIIRNMNVYEKDEQGNFVMEEFKDKIFDTPGIFDELVASMYDWQKETEWSRDFITGLLDNKNVSITFSKDNLLQLVNMGVSSEKLYKMLPEDRSNLGAPGGYIMKDKAGPLTRYDILVANIGGSFLDVSRDVLQGNKKVIDADIRSEDINEDDKKALDGAIQYIQKLREREKDYWVHADGTHKKDGVRLKSDIWDSIIKYFADPDKKANYYSMGILGAILSGDIYVEGYKPAVMNSEILPQILENIANSDALDWTNDMIMDRIYKILKVEGVQSADNFATVLINKLKTIKQEEGYKGGGIPKEHEIKSGLLKGWMDKNSWSWYKIVNSVCGILKEVNPDFEFDDEISRRYIEGMKKQKLQDAYTILYEAKDWLKIDDTEAKDLIKYFIEINKEAHFDDNKVQVTRGLVIEFNWNNKDIQRAILASAIAILLEKTTSIDGDMAKDLLKISKNSNVHVSEFDILKKSNLLRLDADSRKKIIEELQSIDINLARNLLDLSKNEETDTDNSIIELVLKKSNLLRLDADSRKKIIEELQSIDVKKAEELFDKIYLFEKEDIDIMRQVLEKLSSIDEKQAKILLDNLSGFSYFEYKDNARVNIMTLIIEKVTSMNDEMLKNIIEGLLFAVNDMSSCRDITDLIIKKFGDTYEDKIRNIYIEYLKSKGARIAYKMVDRGFVKINQEQINDVVNGIIMNDLAVGFLGAESIANLLEKTTSINEDAIDVLVNHQFREGPQLIFKKLFETGALIKLLGELIQKNKADDIVRKLYRYDVLKYALRDRAENVAKYILNKISPTDLFKEALKHKNTDIAKYILENAKINVNETIDGKSFKDYIKENGMQGNGLRDLLRENAKREE